MAYQRKKKPSATEVVKEIKRRTRRVFYKRIGVIVAFYRDASWE